MSKGAATNDINRNAFREEAHELLGELEDCLLELEQAPDDRELIGKVFRVMHTIKGSGAMFGFDEIAAFTHEIETVYDGVRSGEVAVTKALINLTLEARDHLKRMLDEPTDKSSLGIESEAIIRAFTTIGAGTEEPRKATSGQSPDPGSEAEQEERAYRVRFSPSPGIFRSGTNPLLLIDEMRGLGDCLVVAQLGNIPGLEEMDPESCYTAWDVVITTNRGIAAIRDVFIFVEDDSEIRIEAIERTTAFDGVTDYKKLGEILVERGDVVAAEVERALAEKKRLGELLVEKRLVTPGRIQSALAEQQHVRRVQEKKEEAIASIRVPSKKLDVLVNLVGELVTLQARLSETAALVRHTELTGIAEDVERLTSELRDNTLNIRMLPIGSTFGRFKRLIRDLSEELHKEIEMTTEGAETELDKTVIEKLSDPLVHVIRNCVDHGIEEPEARVAARKPKTGRIHLSAMHSGANVMITVEDDGKGLDRDSILAKGIERGLVPSNAELTDQEIFNLIFSPGFSTAETVTAVSGRGVGMDVVKKAVDGLGGAVSIESRRGKGTRITIKLPLTLAIVEGLVVQVGHDQFVVPLAIVEECVELTREETDRCHGHNVAHLRDQLVPYIRLRDEFGIVGEPPGIEQIVVTGIDGGRIGFVVDSVIGEHQTVIKNLGRMYRDVNAISGATILGNGTVALIIDVPKLVRDVELAEAANG